MSEFIKDFSKKNKSQFLKYKKYITANDWSDNTVESQLTDSYFNDLYSGDINKVKKAEINKLIKERDAAIKNNTDYRAKEFKIQNDLMLNILSRLKYFVKKTEGDHYKKEFKSFIKTCLDVIKIHTDRVDTYVNSIDISKIESQEVRSEEIKLVKDCFAGVNTIEDGITSLNIKEDTTEVSAITFHENTKIAQLCMHEILYNEYPIIKRIIDSMDLDWTSPPKNEMHIYNENAPKWNGEKHYFLQEKETLQYYIDEYKKLENGIVVDGVSIEPWLYFHINHFMTEIPTTIINKQTGEKKIKKIVKVPDLRDNEYFIINDSYRQAREDGKILFIAATRRLFKSTGLASHLYHKAITGGKELLVAGGSAKDLGQLEKNIKVCASFINPAFAVNNISSDWTKKIPLGIRTKTNKIYSQCVIHIVNLDGGTNSEILAGFTPDALVIDEVLKGPFIDQLNGAKPSFDTPNGMLCTPILSGCVCAGTKVWNNKGEVINIEDLTPEQGIIGFDIENQEISKENITYWQKPHKKECFRIETNQGRFLECSDDHPILTRIKYNSGKYKNKTEWVETSNLKVGDSIAVIENLELFGNDNMYEPRLTGWIVGDGSYGKGQGTSLMNADPEILKYIHLNFKTNVYEENPTKDGRLLQKTTITGLVPHLKKLGIYGQTKDNKRLPANIDSFKEEDICEFIGGYYDADGCAYHNEKTGETLLKMTSANVEILRELKLLLQKLGIHGNLVYEKPNFDNPKTTRGHYNIIIKDKKSILKFHSKIKFYIKCKQDKLEKGVESLKNKKQRHSKNEKGLRFERIKAINSVGQKEVYNLTAGKTHTYVANGIITHNTGGDEEMSRDGHKVLNDPGAYKVLKMNWDALERGIPKEDITWIRREFGTFAPAAMSAKTGMIKIESNLAKYLNKPESKELEKIKIQLTDWKRCNEIIDRDREALFNDRESLTKEVVYYPKDPVEIFKSGKLSPFDSCLKEAKAHKDYLIKTGLWDRRRDLYRDSQGKIRCDISTRELANFPHKGGIVNAPFLIFEDLPQEKPKYGEYVGSFDDYATEESDTDSVSTFYVMKNKIIGDPFSEKIVASISFRPERHLEVYEKWLLLMEAYNLEGTTFGENFNYGIKEFLDRKHLADKYLAPSLDFSATFNIPNNLKRKTGWNPTTTKKLLFEMFVTYCTEEFEVEDENGNIIILKGVQRIDDIYLLDEIISYTDQTNVDRITSAMANVGFSYYLQSSYKWKVSTINQNKKQEESRPIPERNKSFYGGQKNRAGFYGRNRR